MAFGKDSALLIENWRGYWRAPIDCCGYQSIGETKNCVTLCYKMFVIAPFSSLIDLRGASQEVGAYLIKDILLQSIVQWNVLATTL